MQIDFNEMEMAAMEAALNGNMEEMERKQQQFLEAFKNSRQAGEDHCPCTADCSIHGKCLFCVQIHRGHGDHLPQCMQLMVNKRLKELSHLTEHSLAAQIAPPAYIGADEKKYISMREEPVGKR